MQTIPISYIINTIEPDSDVDIFELVKPSEQLTQMREKLKTGLHIPAWVSLFLGFAFLGIIGLGYYFQPRIETNLISTQKLILPEKLNSTNNGLEMNYNQDHIIELNGQKWGPAKQVFIPIEAFKQGKNNLKTFAASDYLVFTQAAKNAILYEVNVDTIKPELEILEIEKAVLGNVTRPSFRSETGASFKNLSGDERGTFAEDTWEFRLALKDGRNDFSVQAQDSFGNLSEVVEFSIQAFIQEGYTTLDCNDFKMPVNQDLFKKEITTGGIESSIQACNLETGSAVLSLAEENSIDTTGNLKITKTSLEKYSAAVTEYADLPRTNLNSKSDLNLKKAYKQNGENIALLYEIETTESIYLFEFTNLKSSDFDSFINQTDKMMEYLILTEA